MSNPAPVSSLQPIDLERIEAFAEEAKAVIPMIEELSTLVREDGLLQRVQEVRAQQQLQDEMLEAGLEPVKD